MGRATLGVFRSTPLGIVAAGSSLTPARALLSHRQARFAYRLHARPKNEEGPKEILTRDGAALMAHPMAASALRTSDTVKTQEWGSRLFFPGQIVMEGREGALEKACSWARRHRLNRRLAAGQRQGRSHMFVEGL